MPRSQIPPYQPPTFEPHRLYRGGHLQTILSINQRDTPELNSILHTVAVSDGDFIALHEDRPADWKPEQGSMLMIHGLSGCHASPYMIRLAHRFYTAGIRVYRMDMRGVGAVAHLSRNVLHSGRHDDLVAALSEIAKQTVTGPMMALGVSLGGHQLLRMVSRIGSGLDPAPPWFDRLVRIATVAPPFNLPRCSENMQRLSRRIYNLYFIRNLIAQTPPLVRERDEYQRLIAGRRPRTLVELDERMTAPLSGFDSALDYYRKCSVHDIAIQNPVETLVLVAADDPIVPVSNFTGAELQWPDTTTLHVVPTGGHAGFIDRDRNSWMDLAIARWFDRPLD
jgi:predicted alpha/beta-fold hydrolase